MVFYGATGDWSPFIVRGASYLSGMLEEDIEEEKDATFK